MADPFVGEIRMTPFNFAPTGWAFCNGQLLPISQNTALFSLLGTQYGGDGKSTFALPDLIGRTPIAHGQGPGLSDRFIGETGGQENVTLLETELTIHTHTAYALPGVGDNTAPDNAVWAGSSNRDRQYSAAATPTNTTMSPLALSLAGGGLPHNNMPPYLTLNFIIALQGVFPPRT